MQEKALSFIGMEPSTARMYSPKFAFIASWRASSARAPAAAMIVCW